MFYVYAYLRDDGSPYYVGKGKDKRAWRKGKSEINPPTDKSKIIIIENNLSEIGAFALDLLLCPHCNKTGGASNMKRYHIDNCKSIGV